LVTATSDMNALNSVVCQLSFVEPGGPVGDVVGWTVALARALGDALATVPGDPDGTGVPPGLP
jgi:hypothetical protein